MKKTIISILITSMFLIGVPFVATQASVSQMSIKDFINLLIIIGVIAPDKVPAVNAFLATLDSNQTATSTATTTSPLVTQLQQQNQLLQQQLQSTQAIQNSLNRIVQNTTPSPVTPAPINPVYDPSCVSNPVISITLSTTTLAVMPWDSQDHYDTTENVGVQITNNCVFNPNSFISVDVDRGDGTVSINNPSTLGGHSTGMFGKVSEANAYHNFNSTMSADGKTIKFRGDANIRTLVAGTQYVIVAVDQKNAVESAIQVIQYPSTPTVPVVADVINPTPDFSFVSGSATNVTNQDGLPAIQAQFVFSVKPQSANIKSFSTDNIQINYGNPTPSQIVPITSVTSEPSSPQGFSQGETYTVTVTTSPVTPQASGGYIFYLSYIKWSTEDGKFSQQTTPRDSYPNPWSTNVVMYSTPSASPSQTNNGGVSA